MVRGDREARVELGEDNLIGGRSGGARGENDETVFPVTVRSH